MTEIAASSDKAGRRTLGRIDMAEQMFVRGSIPFGRGFSKSRLKAEPEPCSARIVC